MKRLFSGCAVFALLILFFLSPGFAFAAELLTLKNCTFVKTDWADGDSFLVRDEQGKEYTFRLYGVDCLEYHVNDKTDARRLRAQRRYFGISKYKGSEESPIAAAKKFGKEAAIAVENELQKPFTVHTAFADARGDGKYKRYYAFLTTSNGDDLGEKLVKLGLARAFGVYRKTPNGQTRDEYRDWLKDIEFRSAKKGDGIWDATDWNTLPAERQLDRQENAELELAIRKRPLGANFKINLNAAARDELMRLPGIGEVLANRIIERRPYKTVESILEVDGIGPKKYEKFIRFLSLAE